DMDLQACRMKRIGQASLIAPRGFQSHRDRLERCEAPGEIGDLLGLRAAAPVLTTGMKMNVQMGFGYVDADDAVLMYHGLAPRLVVRAKARSTVRGQREQAGPCLTAAVKNQPETTASCLHQPGCASRLMLQSNTKYPHKPEGRT